MGNDGALLWAAVALLWVSFDMALSARKAVIYRKFEGRRCTTNIISETTFHQSTLGGQMECSILCYKNGRCQSFNIGETPPHCQLLSLGSSDVAISSTNYAQYFNIHGIVSIETDNGGSLGNWRSTAECSPGSYIYGVRIKYDEYSGDDAVGVSQLQIFCKFPNGYQGRTMTIGVYDHEPNGTWLPYQQCPLGTWIKAYDQSVTPPLGNFVDDDALNNLIFHCSSDANGRFGIGTTLLGTGDTRYPVSSAECPFSMVACGARARSQRDQRFKDDTAMNHVQFECCFIDV